MTSQEAFSGEKKENSNLLTVRFFREDVEALPYATVFSCKAPLGSLVFLFVLSSLLRGAQDRVHKVGGFVENGI